MPLAVPEDYLPWKLPAMNWSTGDVYSAGDRRSEADKLLNKCNGNQWSTENRKSSTETEERYWTRTCLPTPTCWIPPIASSSPYSQFPVVLSSQAKARRCRWRLRKCHFCLRLAWALSPGDELSFSWRPYWAYLAPPERNMDGGSPRDRLSQSDMAGGGVWKFTTSHWSVCSNTGRATK